MEKAEIKLGQIEKKKVMVIFPHPDDEVFMAGGLVQRMVSESWEVEVISLTQGGRGKNHRNGNKGEKLKQIRKVEFELAMIELGVNKYQIWDFADGKLRDIGLFEGIRGEWKRKLKEEVRKFKPGLVVSYGPTGVTGHPDHIVLGEWLFEFLSKEMPETGLWWPVWPGILRQFMVHSELRGMREKERVMIGLSKVEMRQKCRAIKSYESQLGNFSWWQKWLIEKVVCWREYFAVADYGRQYQFKYVKFKID